MASTIKVVGQASTSPASASASSSDTGTFNLGLSHQYSEQAGGNLQVNGTDSNPFVLSNPNVDLVRFLSIRALGGASFKVQLTSAVGTNQMFRLSDLLVLHSPNVGDELVAINLIGTGEIEYKMAGEPNGSSPPFVPPPQTIPTGYFNAQPNVFVQYVQPNGDDAFDGLDWRRAKRYVMSAVAALPKGGTIHIMSNSYAGGTIQKQGVWLTGGSTIWPGFADLNQSGGNHRGFTLIGYTGDGFSGSIQEAWPSARVLAGKPTDTVELSDRRSVGLWITANSGSAIEVRGLNFQDDFCIPMRFGVSGDPNINPDDASVASNRGTAQTTGTVKIVDCATNNNGGHGRDIGPGIDVGYCLWFHIEDTTIVNPTDQPRDSTRRALVLINPSEGSTEFFMRNCRGTNGGVIYNNGPSNWTFDIRGLEVEAPSGPCPALFKANDLNIFGEGVLDGIQLNDGASGSDHNIILNHDGTLSETQISVHRSGADVIGPCMIFSTKGQAGGVIDAGGTTFAGNGQFGFGKGQFWGQHDGARFGGHPVSNRFRNLYPKHDGLDGQTGNLQLQPIGNSLTVVTSLHGQGGLGAGTWINAAVKDRRGGNDAFQISSTNADDEANTITAAGTITMSPGDAIAYGFWCKHPNLIATRLMTLSLIQQQADPKPATFSLRGLNGNAEVIQTKSGKKEWQFYSGYAKVLSLGGGTSSFQFIQRFYGSFNNPQIIDCPVCIWIKASDIDGGDQNELGAIVQNMQDFVQADPGSGVSSQPFQKMLAQGGLGVGNSFPVAGHTVSAVTTLIPIYDGQGVLLCHVEGKTLLT